MCYYFLSILFLFDLISSYVMEQIQKQMHEHALQAKDFKDGQEIGYDP